MEEQPETERDKTRIKIKKTKKNSAHTECLPIYNVSAVESSHRSVDILDGSIQFDVVVHLEISCNVTTSWVFLLPVSHLHIGVAGNTEKQPSGRPTAARTEWSLSSSHVTPTSPRDITELCF